jgi:hypothetical protein
MKGELEAAVELYSKSIESFPTAEATHFEAGPTLYGPPR